MQFVLDYAILRDDSSQPSWHCIVWYPAHGNGCELGMQWSGARHNSRCHVVQYTEPKLCNILAESSAILAVYSSSHPSLGALWWSSENCLMTYDMGPKSHIIRLVSAPHWLLTAKSLPEALSFPLQQFGHCSPSCRAGLGPAAPKPAACCAPWGNHSSILSLDLIVLHCQKIK